MQRTALFVAWQPSCIRVRSSPAVSARVSLVSTSINDTEDFFVDPHAITHPPLVSAFVSRFVYETKLRSNSTT